MYDFVVVGGGSAGCVLANRLSENPDYSVCLVEAGREDKSPFIHIPFGVIALIRSTVLNWAFWTEPQKHLRGRRMFWPRGRMLGGSSSLNAMVYMRGDTRDYDDWEKLGNKGWGWKDVLSLFKRVENNERGASDFHGVGGPLNVSELRARNVLSQAFIDAAAEVGYKLNSDFNGPDQEGFGFYQVTQKDGRRWSAASAFLAPARNRPNLTVITEARATRILFQGKRAIGLAYRKNGLTHEALAAREIILAGGAVNSPQLLLLSGVGPAMELKRHDITQVHELPGVGQNLQDHLDITHCFRLRGHVSYGLTLGLIPRAIKALFDLFIGKKGFLTSNLAESGGFLRSSPELERSNLQFHFIPAPLRDHGLTLVFGHGYTCHVCDLRPKSRGYIGLKSADPLADPLIEPNYLQHPDDLKTLMDGYKVLQRIFAAKTFDRWRKAPLFPSRTLQTDDEIRDDILQRAETVYHPVGTCKMGNDPMAVVDAQLRVHGLERLRVADASIMPTLIGGNTNAPSMMIGEKAAEMILAAARNSNAAQAVNATAA